MSKGKPSLLIPTRMNSLKRLHMLTFLVLAAFFCGQSHGAERKPNIVVITADDLVWRDLHCCGKATAK